MKLDVHLTQESELQKRKDKQETVAVDPAAVSHLSKVGQKISDSVHELLAWH